MMTTMGLSLIEVWIQNQFIKTGHSKMIFFEADLPHSNEIRSLVMATKILWLVKMITTNLNQHMMKLILSELELVLGLMKIIL